MTRYLFLIPLLASALGGAPTFSTFCPPSGDGGDGILNTLMNRATAPDSFQEIPVRQFLAAMPRVNLHRAHMQQIRQPARKRIDSLNGTGVTLEGYLVGAALANPQAAECHDPKMARYWLWIAPEKPNRKKPLQRVQARSVMAVVTPEWRSAHPRTWQLEILSELSWSFPLVRVSGWVMLNPQKPDQLGRTRASLWEVHPVVKIETWSGGRWTKF